MKGAFIGFVATAGNPSNTYQVKPNEVVYINNVVLSLDSANDSAAPTTPSKKKNHAASPAKQQVTTLSCSVNGASFEISHLSQAKNQLNPDLEFGAGQTISFAVKGPGTVSATGKSKSFAVSEEEDDDDFPSRIKSNKRKRKGELSQLRSTTTVVSIEEVDDADQSRVGDQSSESGSMVEDSVGKVKEFKLTQQEVLQVVETKPSGEKQDQNKKQTNETSKKQKKKPNQKQQVGSDKTQTNTSTSNNNTSNTEEEEKDEKETTNEEIESSGTEGQTAGSTQEGEPPKKKKKHSNTEERRKKADARTNTSLFEQASSTTDNKKPKSKVQKRFGLVYEDIKLGKGRMIAPGKMISVAYKVYLRTGEQVDESLSPPLIFRFAVGQVVKGLDDGLKGMRVGGRRKIVVPSHLGYGTKQNGAIPPNSTLLFDVELIDTGEQLADQLDSKKKS